MISRIILRCSEIKFSIRVSKVFKFVSKTSVLETRTQKHLGDVFSSSLSSSYSTFATTLSLLNSLVLVVFLKLKSFLLVGIKPTLIFENFYLKG